MFAIVIEDPENISYFSQSTEIILRNLGNSFQQYLMVLVVLFCVGLVASLLYSVWLYHSVVRGIGSVLYGIVEGFQELLTLPLGLRRIGAVASLTIREAIRRRILYVFLLFIIPFGFAGWFLVQGGRDEGQLEPLLGFVNITMLFILVPLVTFMVSMNMPTDIQNRTIQTVVTKPIRRSEILLGRVLGFMSIYTVVILFMGLVSFVYLRQSWYVNESISQEVKARQWDAQVPVMCSPLPKEYFYNRLAWEDKIRLRADKPVRDLKSLTEEEFKRLQDENLPIHSPRLLYNKRGQWGIKGTHVGKMWEYRSHIEGATTDRAIWYFEFDPSRFKRQGRDTVPLLCEFAIFRTTKGVARHKEDKNSGVFCQIKVWKSDNKEMPEQDLSGAKEFAFPTDNFRLNRVEVPIEYFETGRLWVQASCLTRNQFLGMAPADLYFLADEVSFGTNFFKSLISLWLKVLFITCIAVMASTVLKGFVAVLFTSMFYMLGWSYNFFRYIGDNEELPGGGPVESLIRLVTRDNQVTELEPTTRWIVDIFDKPFIWFLDTLEYVVPNFSHLDTLNYVSEAINIPANLMLWNILYIFGYVIPALIVGFFLFRAREIAA